MRESLVERGMQCAGLGDRWFTTFEIQSWVDIFRTVNNERQFTRGGFPGGILVPLWQFVFFPVLLHHKVKEQ